MAKGPSDLFRIRLAAREFGRDDAASFGCLGSDLGAVIRELGAHYPHARWYAASIEASGSAWPQPFGEAAPIAMGTSEDAAARVDETPRFQWASLAAVPGRDESLRIPGDLLHADAPEAFPLGNALAYVRVVDGAFVEVVTADVDLVKRFAHRYGRGCIARAQY
jgi:hypothetical protein